MAVTALIGLVLSAIGVLLIRSTFQETRKTNQIAKDEAEAAERRAQASFAETARAIEVSQRNADAAGKMAEAAHAGVRPYFSMIHPSAYFRIDGPDGRISFASRNIGTTPAFNLKSEIFWQLFRGKVVLLEQPWVEMDPSEDTTILDISPQAVATFLAEFPENARQFVRDAMADVAMEVRFKLSFDSGLDTQRLERLTAFRFVFGVVTDSIAGKWTQIAH